MSKLVTYLKSWAESLFNAKKAFIVNQGLPLWLQNQAQEIQLSYEDAHAGTPAPYDSYVQVRTSSSAGNTVVTAFSIGKRVFSLTGGATSGSFDCAFPVRKGDTIRVDSSSPESMGNVTLGFYKFVGGGNRLIAFLRNLFGSFVEVCHA